MEPDNHKQTDILFWRIAMKDDEVAFGELFNTFFSSLCVFANYYIGCKKASEDIVQDVFFKIWKNRKTLDITSSTRNFLITSVKNSCIDYLRRKDVEENYRIKEEGKTLWSYSSDELYSVTELEEMINYALAKLPDNIRQVFEMNRFQDLTYVEIAAKNNISVKTVEAYMSKALKILRVELKDYLPFIILFL